jgi:hypothetical protein
VAVVVLVLVIVAAILAVIEDVETVSSADSAKDSTRDVVATKNVTMISSAALAISSIGNR